MKCLRDKTLLLLHDGEGSSAQRNHLAKCEACAARYRDLERDLVAIGHVLREKPSQEMVARRLRPFSRRWLPLAVTAALALIVIWQGMRLRQPSAPSSSKASAGGEAWILSEGLPSSLFLLTEAIAVELGTSVSGSYDAAAAVLESDRPCEWYDLPVRGEGEFSPEDLELSAGTSFPSCVAVEINSAHEIAE